MADGKDLLHGIKEDHYAEHYCGTSYDLKNADIKTMGDLVLLLDAIAKDVEELGDVEIDHVDFHDGKLTYFLKESIVQ